MSTSLAPIAPRLGQLVRMLGSPADGEVVAAARAITRTLKSAGLDLHTLADRVEREPTPTFVYVERDFRPPPLNVPPSWDEIGRSDRVRWLEVSLGCPMLTDWQRGFVASLRAQLLGQPHKPISPKQRAAVNAVLATAWAAGLRP